MKLFLSPHNDDETLFGAFTLLRESPLVVIALDSHIQWRSGHSIMPAHRRAETSSACEVMGVQAEFLGFRDDIPDWVELEQRLQGYESEVVYAPAIEDGGHYHHNRIGEIADRVFGNRVRHYLTYTKAGKSTNGEPVPYEPGWPLLKLKALACYESQIKLASTAPHFLRDQNEYLQA